MSEMECPNCGQQLAPYRTEQQRAGEHEVVLRWVICHGCRHVALQSWMFAENEADAKKRALRDKRAARESAERSRRDPASRVVLRSFTRRRETA
jgi:RNase P subunit RPR2